MTISKGIVRIITLLSFIMIFVFDYINIFKIIDINYDEHIDGTIANIITFISILIGFISTIYVLIQQTQDSHVLELLRTNDLLKSFNKSFRSLMYFGFVDVIILISMNFIASNFTYFKLITYIACPLTVYFLISSTNIITTICKMILAEEQLKKESRKVERKDIKN